jgi:hypothetical protein
LKQAEVCSDCGAEYLSQGVMEEVEAEVKSRRIGLRREGEGREVRELAGNQNPAGDRSR